MTRLNKNLSLIICVTLLLFSSRAIALQAGITGYSGNPSNQNGSAQNCSSGAGCHTGGIPPTVVFQGPTQVIAGSINNKYKIIMKNGQDKIGGLNVSVDKGSLLIRDGKTKLDPESLEITHVAPAKPVLLDGTTISWLFDWNAPDISEVGGTAIIYAALLSADKDGSSQNDSVKTIMMKVEVVSALTTTAAKPKAIITAPFTAPVGVAFPLIGSKSSVTNGLIQEYSWSYQSSIGTSSFTHSTVDKGEQILKSFESTGLYTIILTVTSDQNVSQSTYFDILITKNIANDTNSELVPFANISAPTTGVIGIPVTFSSAQSKPIPVNLFIWDFGDNNGTLPPDPNASIRDSSFTEINHTYSELGTYTVTLAVRGINNLTNVDTFIIKITDGSGEIQKIATGSELFNNLDATTANTNCTDAGCHGIGGIANGPVKSIQGASRVLIDTAIAGTNNVLPLMVARIDNVRLLDALGSQKIADYLGTVPAANPTPITIADKQIQGKLLYEARCLLCHGVKAEGVNTRGRNIQGFTRATILDAIKQIVSVVPPKNAIPLMDGIHLTSLEAEYIEIYLATLLPKAGAGNLVAGETSFEQKCSSCHGTGTGGYAKDISGTSITRIKEFLSNQTEMQNIKLTAVDIVDIQSFLVNGQLPIPTTGAGLYAMYCSYCHGVDGAGGAVAVKSIRNKNKITGQFIQQAYLPQTPGVPLTPASIILMKNTSLRDPRITAFNDPNNLPAGLANLQLIADFLNPPVVAAGVVK